ncbi:MAG: hypothetical protein Q8Q09_07810 [Deltaproteobacteria bacterium]|nr:hypothetical protein [Deltaproteobacteria bacterium]
MEALHRLSERQLEAHRRSVECQHGRHGQAPFGAEAVHLQDDCLAQCTKVIAKEIARSSTRARVSPEERIAELERLLAEREVELEKLQEKIKQRDEVIDSWKRGHRTRRSGKWAQQSKDDQRALPKPPGRKAGHKGSSRHAPQRIDREVFLTPPEISSCCNLHVRVLIA